MKISIDKTSGIPLYRQIIKSVENGIKNGSIVNGETLPSLNRLASQCGISMETAKKAYESMKKSRIISGRQGKGYVIDMRNADSPTRIFLLLDKLSAYKLAIHHGLTDALVHRAEVTIHLYNQDIGSFEKMVSEAAGNFDYYIVAPHFDAGIPTSRIGHILGKFPNDRLILIDRNYEEIKGKMGRIYQDFASDGGKAIQSGLGRIRKYSNVVIIHSAQSLYADTITPGICDVLTKAGIKWSVTKGFLKETMTPGTLFIVLGGQLDTEHFTILREASDKGYALGKAVGLITFNDEPVNEFICGGLASLSSDFYGMGRAAAEMINRDEMTTIHNPFSLVTRNSI